MKELNKLYLGYKHGFIGNPKGFARDAMTAYNDQKDHYDIHVPYLQGDWNVQADCIESCAKEGSYIALLWEGESLNIVASSENPTRLYIEFHKGELSSLKWGNSVQKEGKSFFIEIHEKKQYELISDHIEDPWLVKIVPTQVGQKIYEFIL